MAPVIKELVPQQPIDACGLNYCMSRARHFFELKRKYFFDFTLFLGVPRGIFPEKMSECCRGHSAIAYLHR
jgi:hypothetical protein